MGESSRDDLYPAYVVSHEAWYFGAADLADEEITVCYASREGGVRWEFTIRRVPDIGIKVGLFDDSWDAFVDFPALFVELARLGRTNLDEVREVLDRLGFADITERERVSR